MNAKLIENKAKKLIGKKALITMRKNKNEFLQTEFRPVTFEAIIEDVRQEVIFVKKPSGLKFEYNIFDKYFAIESIENG